MELRAESWDKTTTAQPETHGNLPIRFDFYKFVNCPILIQKCTPITIRQKISYKVHLQGVLYTKFQSYQSL